MTRPYRSLPPRRAAVPSRRHRELHLPAIHEHAGRLAAQAHRAKRPTSDTWPTRSASKSTNEPNSAAVD